MLKTLVKFLLPLLIVIAAILVAKVMIGTRPQLEASAAQQLLPQVQTIEVQLGDVPVSIISHGNVSADIELDLASEVTGRVIWVSPDFEPGEQVSAGDVLLRVDPVSYQLALAEAEASLATANSALADAKALRQRASINEAELNIEAVRHRIAKAKQDLSNAEIRAPFAAVIDRQLVEIGQFVSTGQGVARLLSTAAAQISLPFTAAEAGLLAESAGAEVLVTADLGEQRRQWQGRVIRVEARVDQQSRIVPVIVQIDAPYDLDAHPYALSLGMFVQASVTGRPISTAVRLPNSVLHPGDSVYVLSDGKLLRREVNIVVRQGNTVVVNAGLENGDQVVQTRLDVMFEGMQAQRLEQDQEVDSDA